MSRKDRLEFYSYDAKIELRLGQGDHCVLLQIIRGGTPVEGVVLDDKEAEALGRSLIRRARYSREPNP